MTGAWIVIGGVPADVNWESPFTMRRVGPTRDLGFEMAQAAMRPERRRPAANDDRPPT